jgi:hypothetical protein
MQAGDPVESSRLVPLQVSYCKIASLLRILVQTDYFSGIELIFRLDDG